jgi:succinate dehydrogenase cytochrome b subunit
MVLLVREAQKLRVDLKKGRSIFSRPDCPRLTGPYQQSPFQPTTSNGDFMADGAASKRPLSPHLQIWRFTVTLAASITHRGTGIVLYGGLLLMALWVVGLALNPALFAVVSAIIHSPLGFILIVGFVWSLLFHLMNGLRHLYWDYGRGFALKTATMTAWLVYIAATLATALIIWAGYGGGA